MPFELLKEVLQISGLAAFTNVVALEGQQMMPYDVHQCGDIYMQIMGTRGHWVLAVVHEGMELFLSSAYSSY